MPDTETQKDGSGTNADDLARAANLEAAQESVEQAEERILKEGLPKIHEMFRKYIDDESEVFGVEATRMADSVEKRYDDRFDAEDSAALQEFLQQGEGLRTRAQASMKAVAEGTGGPTPETLKTGAELRARRLQLDQQWELLAETVASEGEDESEMMKFALDSGENIPPMSPAAKRLNEVYAEIQAINKELAAAPGPQETPPETKTPPIYPEASPEGSDENPIPPTEDMKKKPRVRTGEAPPPPPGSEGRAEWLRAKADAETDPAKKQEWTMKYLDEVHGPTEDAPVLLTEDMEKSATAPEATSPEEKKPDLSGLPDFIDYTRIDEVEAEVARKEAQKKKDAEAQAKVDRILSGEDIIDWTEVDAEESEAPVEVAEEPVETSAATETKTEPAAEPAPETPKPETPKKKRAIPDNPLDLLLTPRDGGKRESAAQEPAEEAHAEADIKKAMAEEIQTALAEESEPEVAEKKSVEVEAGGQEPESVATHSERHDGNAEAFGELVSDLDSHLSKLEGGGVDLRTINKPNQLLKALNSAKIISRDQSTGILNDVVRKNTLMTAFKKAMKARNKGK